MSPSQSAAASLCDHSLSAVMIEIVKHLFRLSGFDQGPHGHRDHKVFTVSSMHLLFLTMRPPFGKVLPLVPEIKEGVEFMGCLEDDMAAPAAVAAVRTAPRDKLLPPEVGRSSSAVACLDIYGCVVYKFHFNCLYIFVFMTDQIIF